MKEFMIQLLDQSIKFSLLLNFSWDEPRISVYYFSCLEALGPDLHHLMLISFCLHFFRMNFSQNTIFSLFIYISGQVCVWKSQFCFVFSPMCLVSNVMMSKSARMWVFFNGNFHFSVFCKKKKKWSVVKSMPNQQQNPWRVAILAPSFFWLT